MTEFELMGLFKTSDSYSVPMIFVKSKEVLYRNSSASSTRSLCYARPYENLKRAEKKLLDRLTDGSACVLSFNSRCHYRSSFVIRKDDIYIFIYLTMLENLPVIPCNFLEEENLGLGGALGNSVFSPKNASDVCAELSGFIASESEIPAKTFFRLSELMLKYMFSEDVVEGHIDTDDGLDTVSAFLSLGKLAQSILEYPPTELDSPIVLYELRDGNFSIYLRGMPIYEVLTCAVSAVKPYSYIYEEGVGAFALALVCSAVVNKK